MKSIKIAITGADAQVQQKPLLTCGMVGVPVEFTFDESWQGLQKTAVFRVGMTTLDVLNLDTACVVPHELLLTPYRTLRIGVYGCAADGSLVIPTVWADAGQILPGADPSGDVSSDPTLPVWQQLAGDMVKSVNGIAPDETGNVQMQAGEPEWIGEFGVAGCFAPTDEDTEEGKVIYFANDEGKSYEWMKSFPEGGFEERRVMDDVANILDKVKNKKNIVLCFEFKLLGLSMCIPASYASGSAHFQIPETLTVVTAGSLTGEGDITTIAITRDSMIFNCLCAKRFQANGAHFTVYAV